MAKKNWERPCDDVDDDACSVFVAYSTVSAV